MSSLTLTVGSYGEVDEPTLHTFTLDTETGKAVMLAAVSGLSNPSYIAIPREGMLLAVNEDCKPDDGLTLLLESDIPGDYHKIMKVSGEGSAPCHVAVSPDHRFVATANYFGGSVSVFPLDVDSGTISAPEVIRFSGSGPDERRQAGPHAHFVTFTPDSKLMIVTDLGADCIHVIPLKDGHPDASGLTDVKLESGSGPRHMVFNKKGNTAYLLSEMGGTITIIDYDSKTLSLTPRHTVELDPNHGRASADIHLSPDGRFLYASNRRVEDGIVCFSVDLQSGDIKRVGFTPTGSHPRNFTLTLDGSLLLVACRDDNRIEVYRRDSAGGSLTPLSVIPCPRPVCLIV